MSKIKPRYRKPQVDAKQIHYNIDLEDFFNENNDCYGKSNGINSV